MEPSLASIEGDGAYPTRLVLRDGQRTLTIAADEIVWVEAAGNYVQIYTDRKTHLVRHTVKAMEVKLDPRRFIRVRPSAIVNVDAVSAVNARPGGDYTVVLECGTEIRSSRSFRERVEALLATLPGTARHALANRRRRRERAAERKTGPQAVVPSTPPVAASSVAALSMAAAPPS
ncbi:LytR/AlgR family response regulator transcription factor [Paraliomyxa miuraensis]|uniref:LytR/AlgR family response regulator transcription factor n=1 Tax=Paraliomyxa miuraensis TaxID=376150 RepID=UPI0022595377|nr:LytTR family DNA-binding domain-containing protein [Paraliomyxa miuraensis]MCX4242464.1 LytTR family transcriptional regulator [Paraliomyxa miuraensis]